MDIMSVSEVAKITGKSERWIRHLCTVGKLEAIKIGKRTWMIQGNKDELSAKIQTNDKTE